MAEIFYWPESVGCPLAGGYSEGGDDGVIRTQMQSGPQKARPRVSAVPATIAGSFIVSSAGKQTLEDFYFITLNRTSRFYWPDYSKPLTQDNIGVYRFMARPTFDHVSAEWWRATVSLERLNTVNGHFLLNIRDETTYLTT